MKKHACWTTNWNQIAWDHLLSFVIGVPSVFVRHHNFMEIHGPLEKSRKYRKSSQELTEWHWMNSRKSKSILQKNLQSVSQLGYCMSLSSIWRRCVIQRALSQDVWGTGNKQNRAALAFALAMDFATSHASSTCVLPSIQIQSAVLCLWVTTIIIVRVRVNRSQCHVESVHHSIHCTGQKKSNPKIRPRCEQAKEMHPVSSR